MDDLTGKIKEAAGKLTGNESLEQEGRSQQATNDDDGRNREFGSPDTDRRENYAGDGPLGEGRAEPYPPATPDMTRQEPAEYGDTPRGVRPGAVDDEDSPPLA